MWERTGWEEQLFITVDALSASTIAVGEVATLRHKIWNHAVENTAFVVQIFTGLSDTFFSDRCRQMDICEWKKWLEINVLE